jgi:uncharacterized protein (UPF0371 family)
VAYEAATADIKDFNLIDPFHLETYGKTAVNYNRDVETFPVLKTILERITGSDSMYQSPTDMGVNRAGFGIVDDDAVRDAAKQEIIRRYYRYRYEYAMGLADRETVDRAASIMKRVKVGVDDRPVVAAAQAAAEAAENRGKGKDGIYCGAAIELPDGTILTGKNSPLMHAASSLVLNAVKHLAGIPDAIHLLSPAILESVASFKGDISGSKLASLDLDETLMALCVSAATNPTAQHAMDNLKGLQHCEVHLTHIPTPGDEAGLRRLGVHLTCDPAFPTRQLLIS